MKNILLISAMSLIFSGIYAQQTTIRGTIRDQFDHQPIVHATATLTPVHLSVPADPNGNFLFDSLTPGTYTLTVAALHYKSYINTIEITGGQQSIEVVLAPDAMTISEIVVSASGNKPGENKLDMLSLQLLPVKSAQDLLRAVPGLFIAQHAGGGKAEQIFVRGTDNDHGTDFAVYMDDVPVNLPSHAHGQGYADMHFIIPEIIGKADFRKGPYDATLGDFSIGGAARFQSVYKPTHNTVKVETGMYNNQRVLAILNLIGDKSRKDNAYLAAEGMYNDSYFVHKQHFRRFNAFSRYNLRISERTNLTATGSAFFSDWNASGQLPHRAIDSSLVGRFGALDPSEGGITSRLNFNAKLQTRTARNNQFTHQLYYTRNNFTLYSNFTFFLNDTVNGDAIKQFENRSFFGYKGTWNRTDTVGRIVFYTEAGLSNRTDLLVVGRDKVKDRQFLSNVQTDEVAISNYSLYLSETIRFAGKWSVNLGLRNELFDFRVTDRLNDSLSGSKTVYRFNPKLSVFYDINKHLTLFAKAGQGFHSNYAQSAVNATNLKEAVPVSNSADIGTDFKPGNKTVVSLACWWMQIGSEYRFLADDGSYEIIGDVQRIGMDLAIRYQPFDMIWADVNLNYAHSTLVGEPKDANLAPMQPNWSSTGGLTYKGNKGISGSLRYRFLGQRPATEDGSVWTKSYFLTDIVVKYTRTRYELSASVENLFNVVWDEAQFYDASRLAHETAPVLDFHTTPGTPFYLKLGASLFF